LVVDNEPLGPKLIRSLAAPLDHMVFAFEDSQTAGQRAGSRRFEVAFVAMGAPQLDGLELARRNRKSPLNMETTIVMLSTTDDVKSLRAVFGEGADFVLSKPVTASRIRAMLAAMDSPGWKGKRHAARLPLITEVICTWEGRKFPSRSLNICESGMLLQGSADIEVGQEVGLEFKKVVGRVVRKESPDGLGVGFIGLAPEELNAVQLYVMGRLRDLTPQRDLSQIGMNRLFKP
jgi:CheY-like chemotaxis protein